MANRRKATRKKRQESDLLGRTFFYFMALALILGLATGSYFMGRAIFDQSAIEVAPGKEVKIEIKAGDSSQSIAKSLERSGLIRNEHIFMVQERLFGYHGKFQPGVYLMNTSWKPNMMMAVLSRNVNKTEQLGIDLSTVVIESPVEE